MGRLKIGIKLADGEFYPVIGDDVPARKRLVLTTVTDNQPSVQIDLYRGEGASVSHAEYVGSLIVERIESAPKGVPDIKLDLELDEAGSLSATAVDEATGQSRSLSVSISALDAESFDAEPDFSMDLGTLDGESTETAEPAGAEGIDFGDEGASLELEPPPEDLDTLDIEGPGGAIPDIDSLEVEELQVDVPILGAPGDRLRVPDEDVGTFQAGAVPPFESAAPREEEGESELPDFTEAETVGELHAEDFGSGSLLADAEDSLAETSVPEDLLPDFSMDRPEPDAEEESEGEPFSVPEVEVDGGPSDFAMPIDSPPLETFEDSLKMEPYGYSGVDASGPEGEEERPPRKPRALIIAFVAMGVAICLLSAFLVHQCSAGHGLPPLPVGDAASPGSAGGAVVDVRPTAGENPASAQGGADASAVSGQKATDDGSKTPTGDAAAQTLSEVWHKVRWGDTLWDISILYYRNPWYYGKIARANGIRNPDKIIAGTLIRIPKL